jgi:ribosomal protein S18 acetylase RimI-like enzyme
MSTGRAPEETALVEAGDADFAAMLRGVPIECRYALPPGGVDDLIVLGHVRAIATRLRVAGCRGAWMVVAGGEVVGLCGYKHVPTGSGRVEIGYGIAATRRRRGHATRAVAAMLETARRDGVRVVLAETVVDNLASQRVLEHNGFERAGTRTDPEDGELILWQIVL